MQFLVLGYDGTDAGAKERRLAHRAAHLAVREQKIDSGEQIIGGALLNDGDEMIGSYLIVNFPDRAAVDAWLSADPYVTGKVWEKVEIKPCKIAPPFINALKPKV